jgi:hypothetical protein
MRSREVVSLKPQRSMIAQEWTDNKGLSEQGEQPEAGNP